MKAKEGAGQLGAGLPHRAAAGRAQERRAHGGADRAGAAPCGGQGRIRRRGGTGGGATAGAARDQAARQAALVDPGQYRLAEEGPALGAGGAAILQTDGQAGRLSGSDQACLWPAIGRAYRSPGGSTCLVCSTAPNGAVDAAKRAKAGVPVDIDFANKPAIALEQLRQALTDSVPPGTVLADAVCGDAASCGLRFQASA
jgi:hypothetical protein